MFSSYINHLSELSTHPLSVSALAGLALLIGAFLYSKKLRLSTQLLVQVA